MGASEVWDGVTILHGNWGLASGLEFRDVETSRDVKLLVDVTVHPVNRPIH